MKPMMGRTSATDTTEITTNESQRRFTVIHKSSIPQDNNLKIPAFPKKTSSLSKETTEIKYLPTGFITQNTELKSTTITSMLKKEASRHFEEQNSSIKEDEMDIEEEKDSSPQNVPRNSGISSVGIANVTLKANLSKLAKPKAVKRRPKGDKDSIPISLKETKSPDPFETQHKRTETEFGKIIANTSSPDNPLYHLRQSGKNSPGIHKAYKHFVISVFESVGFFQWMKPITEDKIQAQKIKLNFPKNVLCKQ